MRPGYASQSQSPTDGTDAPSALPCGSQNPPPHPPPDDPESHDPDDELEEEEPQSELPDEDDPES